MKATNIEDSSGSQRGPLAITFLSMASAHEARARNGEPFMIQAQRELATRKAKELGAGIIEEFVEIGASALDHRKRPVLLAMFVYLRDHPEVRYAIFPGLHRVSRNVFDFAVTTKYFRDLGVKIVTATGEKDADYATTRDEVMIGIGHAFADGMAETARKLGIS